MRAWWVGLFFAAVLLAPGPPIAAQRPAEPIARLTDQQFQALTDRLSEPPGAFHSDNLVSNERNFQKVFPALAERHPAGGVYLGVGPEQNFTYIAALKPAIAFIVDIRGENRGLHLLYKALFELAADRAEFLSLLFSRPRPNVTRDATPAELFAALAPDRPTEARFAANLNRILDLLRQRHNLSLTTADVDGLQKAYREFGRSGPAASYTSNRSSLPDSARASGFDLDYAALMQATDADGNAASYLASEDRFRVVKDLEARNLVIPVIGDFGGPIALRAIGDWLRERHATVSVFYLSNVEDYLSASGKSAFCRNVAALPIDERSEFIRPGVSTKGPDIPTRITWSADRTSVVMTYANGTSKEMNSKDADALIVSRFGWGVPFTTLIAPEVRACQ